MNIATLMASIADELSKAGYTLRSGGAQGADQAFEAGASSIEIFIPWSGFEGRHQDGTNYIVPTSDPAWPDAEMLTNHFHPRPDKLERGGRAMMGRNAFQVLGRGFAEPVEFVVCWTPKYSVDEAGRVCDASGGTGQAVRIAYALGIPVYHLSRPDDIVALRKIAKSSDVTP